MRKTHLRTPCWLVLICALAIPACNAQVLQSWNGMAQPAMTIVAKAMTVLEPAKDGEAHSGKAHSGGENSGGDWYRVYFTKPNGTDGADGSEKDIVYALIGTINQSQSDLAIAIYMLDLNEVGEAILAASRRGVKVRMVTDADSLSESPTLQKLQKAGISIVTDHSPALMHDKFMVVDGKAVWSGSYNWTWSCTYRNDNNAMYIESGELAEDYLQEFNDMYYNKHFGEEKKNRLPYPSLTIADASLEVCFSPPGGCAAQVAKAIGHAEKSIRFMAFAFTSDPIAKALVERQHAGLDVSGVIETYQSDKPGGDFAAFQNLRMNVRLDGNPYNMHHKVFILDDKTVILGSFNFSRSADTVNDENLFVITDRQIAGLYLREYERVYAQAQNPAR